MPDLFLFCSEEDARMLAPYVHTIGLVLRDATAEALDLNGPKQADFKIMAFVAGDNAARFQILCVASHSPEREERIEKWRQSLAEAWAGLSRHPDLAQIAGVFTEDVEPWPLMPPGRWGLFRNGVMLAG